MISYLMICVFIPLELKCSYFNHCLKYLEYILKSFYIKLALNNINIKKSEHKKAADLAQVDG